MVTGPMGPAGGISGSAAEWKKNIPSTGSTIISNPGLVGGYAGYTSVGGIQGQQTGAMEDESLIALRNSSPETIKRYSQMLKDAGYRVDVTSKYNRKLGKAYSDAIIDWFDEAYKTGRQDDPSYQFDQFLIENKGTGGKGRTIAGSVRITTPTDAAALIENVFKSELGRLPTPEEVTDYTAKINRREKKPSAATIGTPKIVDGKVITEYTGGFDRNQFLVERIRKMPEYSEKKAQAKNLTRQDLAKVAAANGLDLNRDFGASVDGWIKQIENGTDIDVIKNAIRQTARLGMPDRVANLLDQGIDLETVYAPYKKMMASVLELNPDSIGLNDPTLRGAIGPDKEMTLYDFQRSLRKDPRWQYTNNAREEVSTAALQVLRDFGFQG